jgi:hypothetical protein
MKFHELCELFPPMVGEEYEALVKSMENNGLQEPIILYQCEILDGCNRYRACIDAKVAPRYEEFKGTDEEALAFVIVENLDRRHLTPSQLSCVGAKIATIPHGGDRKSDQSANLRLDAIAQADAGEKLSVSARICRRHARTASGYPRAGAAHGRPAAGADSSALPPAAICPLAAPIGAELDIRAPPIKSTAANWACHTAIVSKTITATIPWRISNFPAALPILCHRTFPGGFFARVRAVAARAVGNKA